MMCPKCRSDQTRCIVTRRNEAGDVRTRRYECRECGARFNTKERVGEPVRGRKGGSVSMAKCKICGDTVKAGQVFHSACWEREANRVAEEFCEKRCIHAKQCTDQDELAELHCTECGLIRLLNLGL